MNRVLDFLKDLSVEVHTVTGSVYQGILSKSNDKSIILKSVILFDTNEFKTIDHVHIELSKVSLLISSKFPIVPKRKGKGFTDGEISSNKNTKRELVRFEMSDEYMADDLNTDNSKWDQFAENEKKFGVTTTFDENLYTTALDKTSKDYKSKEKEAERIAKEIEKKSTSNVHLKEERGQVQTTEIDEETKYSQVLRPQLPKPKNLSFASIAAQSSDTSSTKTSENIEKAQNRIHLFKQTEKRKVQHKKNEDKMKLIEFSKSFKLKTPMPEDIKELLNKSESKESSIAVSKPESESEWDWDVEAPEFQPDEYIDTYFEPPQVEQVVEDHSGFLPPVSDKNVKISYKDLYATHMDTTEQWETDPNAVYEDLYYMPQYYYSEDQQEYYPYYNDQYYEEST